MEAKCFHYSVVWQQIFDLMSAGPVSHTQVLCHSGCLNFKFKGWRVFAKFGYKVSTINGLIWCSKYQILASVNIAASYGVPTNH